MRTFMAGATITGVSVASNRVVARSSAWPLAILARMSALAGATTRRSAARDSWMWPISASAVSAKRSLWTFSSLKASSDRGVTN